MLVVDFGNKAIRENIRKVYVDKTKELQRVWGEKSFKNKKLLPHDIEVLQKLLPVAAKADKILDIGSGDGRWINVLRDHGVVAEMYGIDITQKVGDIEGENPIIADARCLPFKDNTFDLVYSMRVIEHFDESKIAVKEHARVAKKGGYVFITVPHLSLLTIKRFIEWILKEIKKESFKVVRGRSMRSKELRRMCKLLCILRCSFMKSLRFLHAT